MARKKSPSKKRTASSPARPKRGLGRGLSALMSDDSVAQAVQSDIPSVIDIADNPELHEDENWENSTSSPTSPPAKPRPSSKAKSSSKNKSASPKKPASKSSSSSKTKRAPKPSSASPAAQSFLPQAQLPESFHVEITQLERNPEQPRRYFDPALLEELTESIRKKGILQPILVRPIPGKSQGPRPIYQIVAGERRWQAAGMAGLDRLPVFIRDINDQEALEIGVIENVHRADLNPMEEALAYKSLVTQFQRTQEDVAKAVGKSRSYITNMLRLLTLPEKVQTYLAENRLSIGHARAIIAAPDPKELADMIVEKSLSVREAESWVRKLKAGQGAKRPAAQAEKTADARSLESRLSDSLGLHVDLRHKGPGGELRIRYKSLEQFEALMARLSQS